jgi:ubiquinone/menaquinone biosynthesis C-methylase UbiE
MDELVPPIIRDSKWFMFPVFWFAYRGKLVREAMHFKSRVAGMTPAEFTHFYESIETISRRRQTDLNAKCVESILNTLESAPIKILDAGCGNGFLLRVIAERYPNAELHGLDLKPPTNPLPARFTRGSVDALPFSDRSFDVVICTHTLEHCMHLERTVQELKRVAGRVLIVVVPKQRPYYYTVDEHVQFFFYRDQLTSTIGLRQHDCRALGGDWFYRGDLEPPYPDALPGDKEAGNGIGGVPC